LELTERELAKNPGDLYQNYQAAICCLKLNQELHAVEYLRNIAFDREAKSKQPEIYEHSLLALSKILQRHSEVETAIKILQTLLAEIPDSALGHYHLGKCYFEEQLFSECRARMEEFFRLGLRLGEIPVAVNKTTSWAHYYLGKCLEHQGHFERATEEYSQSAVLSPNPAKIYGDIGRVYYKVHNLTDAKKFLELCLTHRPTDRSAQKLLEKTLLEIEWNNV
jgi:tetratricopeptide (TPR) repeat protein